MAHQILHIPELLSEICSYFSIPTPSYEPPPCADVKQASLYRATLAAIAQSHQTLVYPATRVLWNVLDDVRPLINLYVPLEDDRYPSPDSQDTGSSQEPRMITGQISEATSKKHARFAMYARFVRYLNIPASVVIHPTVLTHFATLVRARCGSTLAMLPDLRSLSYAGSPSMTPIVLELICKPPVRSVSLVLNGDWSVYISDIGENEGDGDAYSESWVIDDPIDLRDDVSDDCDDAILMRSLPCRLPLLEELHIKDCPSPRFLLHIERFAHLRVLDLHEVGMCDTATISSLAASPRLVELHLPGLVRGPLTPHDGRGFQPLRTLALHGVAHDKVLHVARTLGCILSCALRDLTIWGWKLRTINDYHEAANILAAGCSNTLKSLRISIRGAASERETVQLRDLIQPLLGMRALTNFYFNWSWWSKRVKAMDADLGAMGQAWPHLATLHIFFDADAEELGNLPSLRGIAALAQHTPRLDTICLPAFTWDMEPPESYPALARRHLNGIVVYDIYTTYVYVPPDVLDVLAKRAAATLIRLFPRMCAWWPDVDEDMQQDFLAYKRWSSVVASWEHADGTECEYGMFGSDFAHAVVHELEDILEPSQEAPELEEINA